MYFNQKIFCQNLKALRELKRMNRYEMSIQSDIIYQYYCAIEKGTKIPNFKSVISIANALNVDISQLLTNETTSQNKVMLKNAIMSQIKTLLDEDLLIKLYDFLVLLKTQMDVTEYD